MARARLILAALISLLLFAPAQAQKSKTTLQSEINTNFPDNTIGAITPAIARSTFTDFLKSWQQYAGVNAQTGTTYTVQASDYGQLITFTSSFTVNVSIPQAIGTFAVFSFYVENVGSTEVILSSTISTVCAVSSRFLPPGANLLLISDGANWQCFGGSPGITQASIRGGTPTWSGVHGTLADGKGSCNVQGYGADTSNSAAVNTAAINAAIAANCRVLYFPSPAAAMAGDANGLPTNCYQIAATIFITGVGAGIWGDGPSVSCISGIGEFADIQTVATTNATVGYILLRHVTAIGVGVDLATGSGVNTQLYNVMASANRVGAQLGAHANQPIWIGGGVEYNAWDGFQFIQTASSSPSNITALLTAAGILSVNTINTGIAPLSLGSTISGTGLPPNLEIMAQLTGAAGGVGTYQTTIQTLAVGLESMVANPSGGGSGWALRDVTCTGNGGSGIFIAGSGAPPNTPNVLDNIICYVNGNYQIYCSAGTVDDLRLTNGIFGSALTPGNDSIRLDCGTGVGGQAPNYIQNFLVETPHNGAAAMHITGGGSWVIDKFLSHNGLNGAYCMQFDGGVNDVTILNSSCDGFLTTGIFFAPKTGGGGGQISLTNTRSNSNVGRGVEISSGWALSSAGNHIWNNGTNVSNLSLPIDSRGDNCGATETAFAPCNWGQLGTVTAAGASPMNIYTGNVTANSQISLTLKTVGGTLAPLFLSTISPAASFTVSSTAGNTSVYNYEIRN
jgi:hypothetical protein